MEGRLYVTCDGGQDDTISIRREESTLYINDVEMPYIGRGTISVYGGGGNDTLIIDEEHIMHDWGTQFSGNVIYSQKQAIETHDVESVQFLASPDSNEITIETCNFALAVNAGGGDDTVTLNNVTNWYVDLDGFSYVRREFPLSLDGGTGANQLVVNDADSLAISYKLTPDRLSTWSIVSGLDVTYHNFNAGVTITANDGNNGFDVQGTAAMLPGYQYTLYLSGGDDRLTIHPRNGDGTPSIASNIGILGGDHVDTIIIDDSTSASGATWGMSNPYGWSTQDFSIAGGAYIGTYFDTESVWLWGSQGDDTFAMDSYQNGSCLDISGNGGDDRVEITPTTRDVATFVTSICKLQFVGGDGYDSFWMHNDNTTSKWSYAVTTLDEWTYFRADRLGLATYYLIFGLAAGDEPLFEYFQATRGTLPPTEWGQPPQPPAPSIDELFAAIRSGNPSARYDLTGDGAVDQSDVNMLVRDILKTEFGDANLDGEFNSSDLVNVFQRGQYEDEILGNSSWADGDWNGDGEFDSADFVTVFQAGGYRN
jgi:hypothetical protein